jgi:hypothetical protein
MEAIPNFISIKVDNVNLNWDQDLWVVCCEIVLITVVSPAGVVKIKHLSCQFPAVLKQLQGLSKNPKVHEIVEQTGNVHSKHSIHPLILQMRTTEVLSLIWILGNR